jgi:hypothetical protein
VHHLERAAHLVEIGVGELGERVVLPEERHRLHGRSMARSL